MLFRDTLRTAFGPETGIFLLIVLVIGVTSWMQTARIVRGDVLALREREFVTAARSIGTRQRRIITRHVLPNVLSPILVSATLGIANANHHRVRPPPFWGSGSRRTSRPGAGSSSTARTS